MDDNTAKVLLATVPAVISAGVTWTIMRHSRRLYGHQQWWERKAKAYDNVVGALADLNLVLSEWEPHFASLVRLSDEYQTQLSTKRGEAVHTIKRLATTGDFLITDVAAAALLKLADSLGEDTETGSVIDEIARDSRAVESCIAIVKAEAKRDLQFSAK